MSPSRFFGRFITSTMLLALAGGAVALAEPPARPGTAPAKAAAAADARQARALMPDEVRVRATPIRITADLSNAPAIERLVKDGDRATRVLPEGGLNAFMDQVRALGAVEVLGRPETIVSMNEAGTLRFQSAGLTEHQDRGFLHGMATRFGLWVQPTRAEGDKLQLSLSGSMLQYTPDQSGAVIGDNAVYTRLRDFDADVKLKAGQPVVIGGPMLKEEGDGGWTALVLIVTPETAATALADATAE